MNARQLTILVCFAISYGAASAGTLEDSFKNPPDSARLWVYWTCQDGHYSMEGTTADLEAMKKAGIGGVLRMDCNVGGIPFGGTPYLSERWRKQFVHAVHECERLGLEFTTITGPGWTGTGGPWIRAEQSMQHLVPVSVTTKGPAQFNQVLPLPQPRISRYHRNQTPQMQKEISGFYIDVALFAFPRREPMIEDIQEKALFVRNPFTSMPGVRPHLPSPASYPVATAAQVIDPKTIIDLTGKLKADGRLTWDVPPGEWTIVRLGVRSTGANTRPAPAAGLGLESDKFNKEALATHFEAFFDPLLKEIGSRPRDRKVGFVALDADSWEMSSQNWTPGFREEFKRRRGYDPWLYFTTYTGCIVGSREQSERFLWDVRTVCQELLLENHAAELKKLCHQRGLRLMIEPYDMNPAGDLDLGSYADFPAGELWFDGFQSGWSCTTAASIAHTMGKSVVLAEAFTSGRGNWQRTPWTLKNQTDWAFAAGINKLSIHGFAHQPDENAPGMTFGPYGVFWNRKQTFWPLVADYHEYLARCSHLLQQGVAVSDILYLTPEGGPQVFLPPPSALNAAGSRLPDKKGYSFDGCSPNILMDRAEVKDGRIVFPGGTSYRMLVLPRFETMTPQLLEKITQLVEAGAIVYGAPPTASPSLSGYPHCDTKVQGLAKQLWGQSTPKDRQVGRGRIILDAGAGNAKELYPDYAATVSVLEQMEIPQDFQSDGPVRYGHRQTDSADIYFIANTSNQTVETSCTFRVQQGLPQLWDPVTAEIRPLPQFTHRDRTTSVPVTFEPHQSFFVMFMRNAASKPAAFASMANFPKAGPVSTIEGAWQVSFDPKWGGPEKVTFDRLQDWIKHSEHGITHYSGIATYRKSFDLPRQPSKRIYLNLGTVHDMARVRLNGKDLGVVWCAPWRVDISNAMKPGKNQLEIEVANRWSNRLIGDAALPPEKRLTKSYVSQFKKDSPLLSSGLIGPVQLLVDPAVGATAAASPKYRDGRPKATLRMDARDHGIVLRHGDGPDECDILGARDAWVFENNGTYYMHYDAAGPKGWLCSLATSKDLVTWEKKGPILDFGKPGEDDSKSASYGVTYHDGKVWHMFYLGTPNVSPAPNLVPSFPYLTMKAKANSPAGPWIKQKNVVPFRTKPDTYYSLTASPGQTIKNGDEFLQFFSATTRKPGNPSVQRTLGIARTKDLDGPWTVDPHPMVPIEEQIENSTIYYEKSNKTWFLFTNHIGIDRGEYTDAIWVYWSKDLNQWNPANKAIVLDGQNCNWSKKCIGLPSVVPIGKRLALFYDAPGGNSTSHMKRHVGLAWLELPLSAPETEVTAAESERLQHVDLRCEYIVNPLGIDVVNPRLSWIVKSSRRGQKQTAYRVLVAGSRDKLDKNVGDLWDSGKVQSDRSIHVVYKGSKLTSRMECFWKVMVWDKDGKPSTWSEPAEWSMGLMIPDDWRAKWITNPAPKRLSHPWLRRTFELDGGINRAVIHVNTASYYQLHINGKKVTPNVLTPGISQIKKRFFVNSYDVTSLLVKGKNCIAVWMGPGWHQPRIGNKYNSPILRTQLDIQTSSGLTVIGTDSSWRVKESCISQIGGWKWNNFGGEHYDGREFVPGWDQADLDDSKWLIAREIDAPEVVHSWQGCESPRLSLPVSPKNIFKIKSGKWVIDFGRPLTGWMNLKMHSLKPGQKIDIYYSDLNCNDYNQTMNIGGTIDGFQHFNQQDVYIASGKVSESFCSRFNYHSFRYALIDGLTQKPAFDDARAMMIEPDIPLAGQFGCSNDLFNSIHETTRYTFRTQNPGLALGTGEAREKSAYGDGGVHLSGYLYNFKSDANFRKWTRDWSDNQREDGWFGHTAPAFENHGGGPPWGGQVSELVRRMAFWYGDTRVVEKMYPQLKRYVEYIESNTKENILRVYSPSGRKWQIMFIGDWAAPTKEPVTSFNQPKDDPTEWEFLNNSYRVLLWRQLADFSRILGRNDEYLRCIKHIQKIRPLIHKEFFVPEKGTYIFSNQASLAMALYAQIPPKDLRPKIMEQLEHEIVVSEKGHLSTGMQGTFIMLDLLTREDRNDLIALIMGQTTYPSWGYIVKELGLNTWPEIWNGGGSNVILVTATPGAWFFEGLGGILPDYEHPGFKNFILRPSLVKSVDWVKCSYDSPYGRIVSNWSKKKDVLTMNITVPANTTATVYVPGKNITEGRLPPAKAKGVTFLRMEKNKAVFKVESGKYELKSLMQ